MRKNFYYSKPKHKSYKYDGALIITVCLTAFGIALFISWIVISLVYPII